MTDQEKLAMALREKRLRQRFFGRLDIYSTHFTMTWRSILTAILVAKATCKTEQEARMKCSTDALEKLKGEK